MEGASYNTAVILSGPCELYWMHQYGLYLYVTKENNHLMIFSLMSKAVKMFNASFDKYVKVEFLEGDCLRERD